MVTLVVRIRVAMAKTADLSNSLNADSHDLTDELNAGVIAGIVIGSLTELGLMAAMVIIAAKHKMKKTKVGCAQDRRKVNRIAGDSNAHRIKDILPDDIAVKCLPISDENM
ncbi:hypothetical protein DPMN_173570 [Dreissena polymorpha]|uniref:Uncharacterized protein n=1 Tax=Dreissena polymorpha TaxID=45954 RepID=A0A9D4E5R0_DREPO|nr:hypothetical protein DPMN_173570 [Dreissena polymorpha]